MAWHVSDLLLGTFSAVWSESTTRRTDSTARRHLVLFPCKPEVTEPDHTHVMLGMCNITMTDICLPRAAKSVQDSLCWRCWSIRISLRVERFVSMCEMLVHDKWMIWSISWHLWPNFKALYWTSSNTNVLVWQCFVEVHQFSEVTANNLKSGVSL